MYRNRIEIEEGIIAAVIDANAFPVVVNIISAKNFTVPKFAVIFEVAKKLYPLTPIDVITIRNELTVFWGDSGIEALDHLFLRKYSVYNVKNVPYWCFILLQMDMANTYKNSLVAWREARIADDHLVASAVLEEVFLMIGPGVDIIELVEKAIIYFDHQKMDFEAQQSREFEELTLKKALQIKRHIGIETAMSNLLQIANNSGEVEYVCKVFAMAIGEMVLSNKVKDQYTLAAETIKNASK